MRVTKVVHVRSGETQQLVTLGLSTGYARRVLYDIGSGSCTAEFTFSIDVDPIVVGVTHRGLPDVGLTALLAAIELG